MTTKRETNALLENLDTSVLGEQGQPMPIAHPSRGEPLRGRDDNLVCLHLASADSSRFHRAMAELEKKIPRNQRQSGIGYMKNRAHGAELLAALCTGWTDNMSDFFELDGAPIGEFSRDKARRLFLHAGYGWLRSQVDRFVWDESHFLPNASADLSGM